MSKYLKIVFYETPSYLAKRLYDAERNKDDGIVRYIIDAWIEWKKDVNEDKVSQNENPKQILNVNNQ